MIVCFGELLLRLEAPGRQRLGHAVPGALTATFAGAEANVAVAVAQLGGAARFVTTLPAGHPLAGAAVRELASLRVDVSGVIESNQGRLGIYYYEPGGLARAAAITYDRADSAFATAEARSYLWDELLRGASRLHLSGVTPAVSASACATAHAAVAAAQALGVPVSLDCNFRSTLWRWSPGIRPEELAARELRQLAARADLLVAGPADVALLLDGATPATVEESLQALASAFPHLRWIASSRRTTDSHDRPVWGGSLFDRSTETVHAGPDFVVTELVDRLGIGDAFAGGLLRAVASPAWSHPDRAIALATAAGALKHGMAGDYLRASLDEVEAALAGASANRVRR